MGTVGVVQAWQGVFSMGKIPSPFAYTEIAFALKELHHGACTYLYVQQQSVLI